MTSTAPSGDAQLESVLADSASAILSIPFETGPSLERIPDDVLHEVLSHLPALGEHHVLFGYRLTPPVIPSSALVRTPTLRALSQTSRLLRSRCLAMAWQRLELCGASLPKHTITYHEAIGEATEAAIAVLQGCPHLLPLIQTVSVVFARHESGEIIPKFAACLALLPNLITIQVLHAPSRVMTDVRNGFKGIQLPSVRHISLPCSAHEIVKSCPNLEEVTCLQGDGMIVGRSIAKGKYQQLRILKGFYAPLLKRLVNAAPNVRYIGFFNEQYEPDALSLVDFPFLDTIEFVQAFDYLTTGLIKDERPNDVPGHHVEQASEILKKSKSQASKIVLVTRWFNLWPEAVYCNPDVSAASMTRKAIQL